MKLNTKLLFLFLIISSHFVLTMDAPFFPEINSIPDIQELFPIDQIFEEPAQQTALDTDGIQEEKPILDCYQCQFPECGLIYDTHSQLRQHIARKHICILPYMCPCPNCYKKFYTLQDTESHIRANHKEKPNLVVAEPSLEMKELIRQETNKFMPRLKFLCKTCDASFANQKSLDGHNKTTHKELKKQKKQENKTPTAAEKRIFDFTHTKKKGEYKFTSSPKKPLIFVPVKPAAIPAPKETQTHVEHQEKLECQTCKTCFLKDYLHLLKHHIYTYHVMDKTCADCKFSFIEPEDFIDHLRKYHKKYIQMPQILPHAERKKLNQAIAKHLPILPLDFECFICDDIYLTKETLATHSAQVHGIEVSKPQATPKFE